MAERPSQQKDRAVPQLSCALCRDRKLKCDKLDPCTNCTSSGVVCVPVYRPRLPRGRHARRARNNTSPSATTPPTTATRRRNTQTVDPSIKPTSAAAALSDNGIDGNVLGSRIDRLESLVQAGDSSRTNSNLESSGLGDFVSCVTIFSSLHQKNVHLMQLLPLRCLLPVSPKSVNCGVE